MSKTLRVSNKYVMQVKEVASKENAKVVVVSAAVEAEVAELPAEERASFLAGLGLKESGLQQVIHEGYDLLHLLTFFTAGPKEVRAWTVQKVPPPRKLPVLSIPILKKDLFGRRS